MLGGWVKKGKGLRNTNWFNIVHEVKIVYRQRTLEISLNYLQITVFWVWEDSPITDPVHRESLRTTELDRREGRREMGRERG